MSGMPVWLSTTLLGLGTVFAGLIGLILVTKIMSYFCAAGAKKKTAAAPAAAAPVAAAPAPSGGIPDRPAFVAAISAAIATVMGAEVSGLRIVSIKKID